MSRLRTPEERVGTLPNASLPPPNGALADLTDEELLARGLRHADERALVTAFDRLFPAMLRIAIGHVGSRAVAEEVVQETWLAAIRGIDRFEDRSALKTWLIRILKNLARTRGSRDARTRQLSEIQAGDSGNYDAVTPLWMRDGMDPEEELLSAELASRIEQAIASLPDRQREIIQLRDVDGWSADEVCNAMGISQTNQRVLLHRARDRVRTLLLPYLAETNNGSNVDFDVH